MIQVDTNLWRGPRPHSLSELKDQGFNRMIDLEYGFENLFGYFEYDLYEVQCKDTDDIIPNSYFLRWSDLWPPTKRQINGCLNLIISHQRTYIHCLSGVDRTGVACMAYRIRAQGWDFDKAYAEWVSLGRHWWYAWWKYLLKGRM